MPRQGSGDDLRPYADFLQKQFQLHLCFTEVTVCLCSSSSSLRCISSLQYTGLPLSLGGRGLNPVSSHGNGCSKLVTQQGCLLSMSLRTSTPRPKLCNSACVLRSYVMNAGNARGKRMLAEPPHPQLQEEQREEHKSLSSPHPEEPIPYSSFPCSRWCESS